MIVGLCEGVLDGIRRGFPDGSTTTTATLAAFNMTLFTGTASQAPWSWLATFAPSQARAYAYTAYLATPKIGLGESATIPDRAFECMRAVGFSYVPTSPGWINPTTHNQDGVSGPFAANPAIDCLMSDIVPDFLTSVQYGMGFDHAQAGDEVVERDGVKVIVAEQSRHFLDGSTIDYSDDLAGAGFLIQNPNAARSCGCGTSFEPADAEASAHH